MTGYEHQTPENNRELENALRDGSFSFRVTGNLENVILAREPFTPIGSFHSQRLGREVHVGLKYLKKPSEENLIDLLMGGSVDYFDSEIFEFDNAWANIKLFAEDYPEHSSKLPLVFCMAKSKTGQALGVIIEDLSEGGKRKVINLGIEESAHYMDSVPELKRVYDAVSEVFVRDNHGTKESLIASIFLQQDGESYQVRVVDTDHLTPNLNHSANKLANLTINNRQHIIMQFPIEYLFNGNSKKLEYANALLKAISVHGDINDMKTPEINYDNRIGASGIEMRDVINILITNGNIVVDSVPSSRRSIYKLPQQEKILV